MKLSNAIKKATKATGNEPKTDGYFYSFEFGNDVLEFAKNGRQDEIICIRTKKKYEKDDHMTDYFCGIWHDNLTQALKFIGAL